MFRILTWNLHANRHALNAALRYIQTGSIPTVAVFNEVPDALVLLGIRTRRHDPIAFEDWLATVPLASPWPWQGAVAATSETTARLSGWSNQSHTLIVYLGPGKMRATPQRGGRWCLAQIDVKPRPFVVVGVHGRRARESEDSGHVSLASERARAIISALRDFPRSGQIVAGDFNDDFFHPVVQAWDGYAALPVEPLRSRPGQSYLANLTWQSVRWKSSGTYWDKKSLTWRWFDQILVDPRSAAVVQRVDVLAEVCGVRPTEFSDHAPLQAALNFEVEA